MSENKTEKPLARQMVWESLPTRGRSWLEDAYVRFNEPDKAEAFSSAWITNTLTCEYYDYRHMWE